LLGEGRERELVRLLDLDFSQIHDTNSHEIDMGTVLANVGRVGEPDLK